MFVAIARFPEVASDQRAEFEAWFAWSNDQLCDIEGLRGRRLLRADDGTYTALVEHENAETFAAMHASKVALQVHARLGHVLSVEPQAKRYEVVADLANSTSCCGGGGHGHHGGRHGSAVRESVELQPAGGCCRRG